jgi:phage tail sheath protein FI
MPVQTSYPGVYVQELPSGVHTIVGVSTSIALFIGRAIQGPVNEPQLCNSYADYVRVFTADISFSDMGLQVQQFFLNGGMQCYALRIVNASSATFATALLQSVGDNTKTALTLTALSPGVSGNALQCVVDYKTSKPESTFNLTIYTFSVNASGQQVVGTSENWPGLSMNPVSPMYAVNYLNQNSALVNAAGPTSGSLTVGNSYSRAARPILAADLQTLLTTNYILMISVGGANPISVSFQGLTGADGPSFQTALNGVLSALTNLPGGVTLSADCSNALVTGEFFIKLVVNGGAYDISVTPAASNDLAAQVLMGVAQGGVEKSAYADWRPAPSGFVFNPTDANLNSFSALKWTDVATVQVNGAPTTAIPISFTAPSSPPPTPLMYNGSITNKDFDGVREKWAVIAAAVSGASIPWTGQVWGSRLAILPTSGSSNGVAKLTSGTTDISGDFTQNLSYYAFGLTGAQYFEGAGTSGADGSAPTLADYETAFQLVDNTVDIFNLMILARDNTTTSPTSLAAIWGPASVFCQQRRAMLLVDPPDIPDAPIAPWVTQNASASQIVQKATNLSTGVNALRVGLVNDHSALYFPRVIVNQNNLNYPLAPSGTLAGVMARIDSSRGVWKAPAGTEANLLGITGLEVKFTDAQNGELNPVAINTLRNFPDGIVSWGARTLDGDDSFQSQWKYIPVRRTALFIEESLYRGLKWVVFEPNAEPLWSQIRLNVGAFMQQLFIQGAFAGTTKQTAYFVACDSSTTTQNDIDLGIVNIIVGFAPLIPAEFVVLSIQQMAGQIQV